MHLTENESRLENRIEEQQQNNDCIAVNYQNTNKIKRQTFDKANAYLFRQEWNKLATF